MTIVASETVSTTANSVRYRFQDHLLDWHYQTVVNLQGGEDLDALRTANAAALETSLDESEQRNATTRVLDGEDSLIVAQDAVHSTEQKITKRLIYWMMRAGKSDDPETRKLSSTIIVGMESLWLHLNATYTDQQIVNLLDITQPKLDRMRTRVNRILNAGATSPKDEMIAIADSAEDWN